MARMICALLFALLAAPPLLAQSPPDAAAFERTFARALEMQKAGDYVGAIETYKAALTIDPKGVDALSNLGAAYVHLGQFDGFVERCCRRVRSDLEDKRGLVARFQVTAVLRVALIDNTKSHHVVIRIDQIHHEH